VDIGLLSAGNNDGVRRSAPPQSIQFARSATQFNQVTVANYGLLVPAPSSPYDGTQIFCRSDRDPGNAIANKEYTPAKDGVCILGGPGQWWINAQTNIAAGTQNMVLYDCANPIALLALLQSVQQGSGNNLRTMSTAVGVVISADAQIIASNANRQLLSISNTGTTNGTTITNAILYLSFTATAATVGNGIALTAGQTLILDGTSGITTQAVRGVSTSGNIQVGVQEAV
jgi:hypothetical protein